MSKKTNANEVHKQVKLFYLLIQIILSYESTLVLFITDTDSYRSVPTETLFQVVTHLLFFSWKEVCVPCVGTAENRLQRVLKFWTSVPVGVQAALDSYC